MVSSSESSYATERAYESEDFSPAPFPDFKGLEEGSLVGHVVYQQKKLNWVSHSVSVGL